MPQFETLSQLYKFLKSFKEKVEIFHVEPDKEGEKTKALEAFESLIQAIGKVSMVEISDSEKVLVKRYQSEIFSAIDVFFVAICEKSTMKVADGYRDRLKGHCDDQFGYRIDVYGAPGWLGWCYLKESWLKEGQPTAMEKLAFDALKMEVKVDKKYSSRTLGN